MDESDAKPWDAGRGPDEANLPQRSFSDVDGSGQAEDHAAYLDRAAARMAERRQRWFEHLRLESGAVVLDAGSGMGEVTAMLADLVGPDGRAVGVDRSAELVARAQERATGRANVEYRVGDLGALPFEDETFDAAYSERVFIHLTDPDAAMRELHRVLRPGGRLVVIDPDFSRAATDADDAELAEILTARLGLEMANFRSGRRLRSQAVLAGFVEVTVEGEARIVVDRDEYRQVAPRPVESRVQELVVEGVIDGERAHAFLADQARREREGRFQVSMVSYTVTALKAT